MHNVNCTKLYQFIRMNITKHLLSIKVYENNMIILRQFNPKLLFTCNNVLDYDRVIKVRYYELINIILNQSFETIII